MTQIDVIRGILETFRRGNIFDISEIQERTDFPRSSVRRILGNLSKTGELSRIEPGLFTVNRIQRGEDIVVEPFHRKFVGTAKYGGTNRQFFGITFEDNDTDREAEILSAIDEFLNNTGYVDAAGTTGYEDSILGTQDVDTTSIYPFINVGVL